MLPLTVQVLHSKSSTVLDSSADWRKSSRNVSVLVGQMAWKRRL